LKLLRVPKETAEKPALEEKEIDGFLQVLKKQRDSP